MMGVTLSVYMLVVSNDFFFFNKHENGYFKEKRNGWKKLPEFPTNKMHSAKRQQEWQKYEEANADINQQRLIIKGRDNSVVKQTEVKRE